MIAACMYATSGMCDGFIAVVRVPLVVIFFFASVSFHLPSLPLRVDETFGRHPRPPPILELSHSLSVRVCVLACRIGGTFFTPFVSLALSLPGALEAVLSVARQCVCARKRAWARRLFYSVLSSSLCACVSFVLSYTSLACHLLVVDDVNDPFTSF